MAVPPDGQTLKESNFDENDHCHYPARESRSGPSRTRQPGNRPDDCLRRSRLRTPSRGFKEQYRGSEGIIRLLSKVKLEIAVNDQYVKPAIDAIMSAAHSGNVGDGKIFVLPLEECYRIRTGEEGIAAIGP